MAEFLALLALPAVQYILVGLAGTSVAVDLWPKIKGSFSLAGLKSLIPHKAVTIPPTEEQKHLAHRWCFLDLRHKVSEMPSVTERNECLLICDEVDKLYTKLYGEAK